MCHVSESDTEESGVGRHPGRQRNYLSPSVPDGASSEIEFVVPMNRNELTMFQIHIRYLLLDTVTGYRSQYHGIVCDWVAGIVC